jgi:hypothetical protein
VRVHRGGALQISGKDLGALALPDFCARCFWIGRHQRRLPFKMPLPGIFSSIDAYTKAVVNGFVAREGRLPDWLSGLGEVAEIVPARWHDFQTAVDGVLLTGEPDALLKRRDGSYLILDYKTARFTGGQDRLWPMYRVQLNVYGFIAESLGLAPVTGLALIYMEPPVTANGAARAVAERHTTIEGFSMPFTPNVRAVGADPVEVRSLVGKAKQICALPSPPPAGDSPCENCTNLAALTALLNGRH